MTNAEKFKKVFGYYATEMWAKPEKEFLDWINAEALEQEQDTQGDLISRQAAIDAIELIVGTNNWKAATIMMLANVPSAEKNCVNCKFYYEIEDDTGIYSHCRQDEVISDLHKLAEDAENAEIRKGIVRAIEVLKGKN